MRIYITTTPNKEKVPFNYQPKLVGTLHKWLGQNDLHGKISLYSFSWLMNAKADKTGLNFPQGAQFFISFYEKEYLKQIINALLVEDPEMFCGMRVNGVSIAEEPDFSKVNYFRTASPIFIQRFYVNGDETINKHYTYEDDPELVNGFLKETLLHKIKLSGLKLPEDEDLDIRFDLSDPNKKIKVMSYREVRNKVSWCRLIINGSDIAKQALYTFGAGNSTGISYGAIIV